MNICASLKILNKAVSECIEAAGYEFNAVTQKELIRAAYFGKAFIKNYNPDEYIKMCRILRVLNAIRHSQIGIPLTLHQLVFFFNYFTLTDLHFFYLDLIIFAQMLFWIDLRIANNMSYLHKLLNI